MFFMNIRQLTYLVDAVLRVQPEIILYDEEMKRVFEQKERSTELGNAIMNLCELPDEKETMDRWAKAQGFDLSRDETKHCWVIRRSS